MVSQKDINTHLPLTESTFLIILSLSTVPKHGYAIMKEVEELSEHRVVMSTGTLYGALKRLLEQDWIERIDLDEPVGIDEQTQKLNPRMRKAYRLTEYGRTVLEAEISRMKKLMAAAALHSEGSRA